MQIESVLQTKNQSELVKNRFSVATATYLPTYYSATYLPTFLTNLTYLQLTYTSLKPLLHCHGSIDDSQFNPNNVIVMNCSETSFMG